MEQEEWMDLAVTAKMQVINPPLLPWSVFEEIAFFAEYLFL